MSLVNTVRLGLDEPPASFASRIAAAYGIAGRELCLDFTVVFQGVVDGEREALLKLAGLGGVSADALAAHAFVRAQDRRYVHRSEILTRGALRRSRVHVCPACIKADIAAEPQLPPEAAARNRAIWVIEAVKTCQEHGIALVEIADDLTPTALHDFAFHVRSALPQLDVLLAAAVRRRPNGLERYVLDRVAGMRTGGFLDGFPLYAAVRICEIFGLVAAFGRTPNTKRLTDDEWWQAGAAGFAVVSQGRPGIEALLADLQLTYPYGRSSNEGPQALFGRAYQMLAFGADDPVYDAVRAIIADYAIAHLPLGPGDAVFGKPVTARTLHSVRTLSTETGLHIKRLRKVLRGAGIIDDAQMRATYNNAVFPAEAAEVVVAEAEGALPLQEAGRYLNAPRVHIELLARERFIVPYVAARAFAAYDRYAKADLDAFLARLLQDAVVTDQPPENRMPIPSAAKRACCSAADILRLILDHKLHWVGRLASGRGYLSVLVDADEIRGKVRGPEVEGLICRQAAQRLRTTDKVIKALIDAGEIKTFVAVNPVNRCPQVTIPIAEIERFEQTYVSLFMLAEQRGQHFKSVLKALEAQGIAPALDEEKIGARFYRRA